MKVTTQWTVTRTRHRKWAYVISQQGWWPYVSGFWYGSEARARAAAERDIARLALAVGGDGADGIMRALNADRRGDGVVVSQLCFVAHCRAHAVGHVVIIRADDPLTAGVCQKHGNWYERRGKPVVYDPQMPFVRRKH